MFTLSHVRTYATLFTLLPLFSAAEPTTADIQKDYAGRPFVTNRAPTLTFAIRTAPRPMGIDYNFKEQTAHGVALVARFPEFTLSDRRVHSDGPWYDSEAANLHFSRGISSIGCMPNYRQGPTDLSKFPPERKWSLLTDPIWYTYSGILADELAKQDEADPRIEALRTLSQGRRMVADEAAYIALGRRLWEGESGALDTERRGFRYAMIDVETTEGWEHQRNCLGWMYLGLIDAAQDAGQSVIPVTYAQWTFNVGAVWESTTQADTGQPEYLKPEKNCLRDNDPTIRACNDVGGVVSMDGYMQGIWGNEPFFKRDVKGNLVMQDGKPQFNDITSTTLYGVEVPLEANEAQKCIEDLYRAAIRLYLMHHYAAGEYPAISTQRLDHLKNIRIGSWSRYSNEGVQGIQNNDRPLPGWEIEMLLGFYLMLSDDIVLWSSDFNHKPGPLGADQTATWKYNTEGVVEYAIKALHRYSALDPIHTGTFNWCWFILPVVDKNESDGHRYDQKPLAFGKLREYKGKPWLELYVAWPGLDQKPATFKLWLDKDGKKSKPYTFKVASGRHYFYDGWELPAGFKTLEGRNVVLEFKDQQGVTRTWRGDWRENIRLAH